MRTTTADAVDSSAARVLELLALFPAALVGIAGLTIVVVGLHDQGADWLDVPLALASLGLLTLAVGGVVVLVLASWLTVPIVLYLDGTSVADAPVDWDPTPKHWALAGAIGSYLVLYAYLLRRHQAIRVPVAQRWWWTVGWVGTPGPLVLLAGALYAESVGTEPTNILLFGAAILTTALLPVALYRDASFVRQRAADWDPNPGLYVAATTVIAPLAPLTYPVVGGYYFLRRGLTDGIE